MKVRTILTIVGLLVASGGLLYAGYSFGLPSKEDIAERNRVVASADSTRQLTLDNDSLRTTAQRAVFDWTQEKELREFVQDSMGDVANALAAENERLGRANETLVEGNAVLEDSLTFLDA